MKPWTLWAVLAAALLLAWVTAAPPSPQPVGAAPTAFSAERAMADVRLLGVRPHPPGSAEHARVRGLVVERLRSLGLAPQVQDAADLRDNDQGVIGANVHNVVAVLPGTDRSLPALALTAHYDSVPASPGAADDTAGVASILETVRALRARGPVARDVIVLITDGEETGLFGAIAFWRDQPLAKRIGLVVNLEARGSSGPAFMFETGPENAGAMGLYGRAVARPEASSLSGWVYDRMPNGTDFTIPKKLGVTGFNIAMIGTPFDYHSGSATPAHLDRRSLQHMGDQSLALADALARTVETPERGPDLVYSEVFGRWLVAYPAWAGWLVLAAAAGLMVLAVRSQGLPPRRLDLARGAGLLLLVLLWPALIAHVAYRLAPVGEDFYQSPTVAQFGLFFAGMAMLAAGVGLATFGAFLRGGLRWAGVGLALALGVACSLMGGFDLVGAVLAGAAAVLSALILGPAPDPRGAGQGLMLAGLVLAAVLQVLSAETAYVIAWPLLAASAVAAIAALRRGPQWVRMGLASLIAAAAAGWTLRMTGFLFDGLGLTNPGLLGLFTALSAMILAPFVLAWVAWGKGGHWAAMALNLSGVALLSFVALHQPWSARTPAPSHVMHVADAATGRSQLVSLRDMLDPWSRAVISAEGGAPVHGAAPLIHADEAWIAPAHAIAATAPAAITVAREGDHVVVTVPTAGLREVRLTLTPTVRGAEATLQGRPAQGLLDEPRKPVRVRWHAPGETLRLAFKPSGPGELTVGWAAVREAWPAGARPLPQRPAEVMASGSSDTAVTTGRTTLSW
jgi:hypothetical protein